MKFIREHSDLSKEYPEYFNLGCPEETKFSYFTYFQKVDDEKTLLYNFISNAIILLNKREFEAITSMKFSENSQMYLSLQKSGFFVNKDIDENAILERQRKKFQSTPSRTLKTVILPTTNCNARCHYCIAKNNPKVDMTTETAKKVTDFIVRKSYGYENISFSWYGGEPLLKHDIITMICKGIQNKIPNVSFTSTITTNLVLFDDNILDSAINNWHIRKVTVTLDGTEQEHNRRKGYLDNNLNGYNKTIYYIEKLLKKGIAIFCRFNVDKKNINDLNMILNDIKRFYSNELFFFYIASLRNPENGGDYFTTSEYNKMAYITNSLLIKNGIVPSVDNLVPKSLTKFCLAKSANSLVIGADGLIYRCNECIQNIQRATGNISKDIEKNETYKYYMNIDLPQECIECKFLPICQGGCPERRVNISDANSPCNYLKFKIKGISKILVENYI